MHRTLIVFQKEIFLKARVVSQRTLLRGIQSSMDIFPPNKGHFEVGCTDLMIPQNCKIDTDGIGGLTKASNQDVPGYFMKLFYPTRKDIITNYQRANWIPKGIYADGFITFMHLPVFLFGRIGKWFMDGTKLCAYEDAPILRTQKTQYPVVVFSHGLGANRTCYSSFCADLASKGFFVAAIEHRDRSASATYYIDENKDEIEVEFRKLIKGEDEYKLRNKQVTQRTFETSMALTVVSKLNESDSSIGSKNMINSKFDFRTLQGLLDLSKTAVAGHSFGGCTALKTLSQDKRFKCGVVLDAWMFPLDDAVYGNVQQPVLFLNSERFHWKGNVQNIKRLIGNDENKTMLTIKGTGHHSQCDIPSVIPSWILRVFGMSAKMDHNQSIELHRKLMTSYLYKYLDITTNEDPNEIKAEDGDFIIEGTNLSLPTEEQEGWYHQS